MMSFLLPVNSIARYGLEENQDADPNGSKTSGSVNRLYITDPAHPFTVRSSSPVPEESSIFGCAWRGNVERLTQ
jgi:hypothetical protein